MNIVATFQWHIRAVSVILLGNGVFACILVCQSGREKYAAIATMKHSVEASLKWLFLLHRDMLLMAVDHRLICDSFCDTVCMWGRRTDGGPISMNTANGILTSSTIFAGFMVMTSWPQTDTQTYSRTDQAILSVAVIMFVFYKDECRLWHLDYFWRLVI